MTCPDANRPGDPDEEATPSLLPHRDPVSVPPRETQRLQFGDEQTECVFDALRTDCARAILRALCVEPMPTADIADTVGTSIQNAAYHLQNLQDAGFVDVVDTWYSSRGLKMAVYASLVDRLVVDFAPTTTRKKQ